MNFAQKSLITLAFFTAMLAGAGQASAWGCVAISMETQSDQTKWVDMSYGYSFQFHDQLDAQAMALKECVRRTAESRTCKILFCESAY